ncbi:MAG: magnesium chelatase ATPase subunit D [Herpetosiphonaceae bacterium]|nr:magnesium chelatase ATPase subunit D [Herpetosiphonaceae bacterium]
MTSDSARAKQRRNTSILPFGALVGLAPAEQALLLLAVEPRLRGVVLAAPAGSGKSSLVRSYRTLLDLAPATFVELGPGADEASVLGGLDIEATLHGGMRVLRRGLLARANGGVIAVDSLNLLPDRVINPLLGALDAGEIRLEREGLSQSCPAHFALLACYDPAEGPPRRHLLDRVGLLVVLPAASSVEQRSEIVRRNLLPVGVQWGEQAEMFQGLILAAREQLPTVEIEAAAVEQLIGLARELGVEGHRADLFAVHAARAAAALALRATVEPEDLDVALQLVLLPRATRLPQTEEATSTPPMADDQATGDSVEDHDGPSERRTTQPGVDQTLPDEAVALDEAAQDSKEPTSQEPTPAEQVLTAVATLLPEDLMHLPFRAVRRGRAGSRGTINGPRGRHIRSLPGNPRRQRIDIVATLRAAAVQQPLRRACTIGGGLPGAPLMLRAEDLQVKHFQSKAGTLFCLAVDASGSMAIHRMRQAKGAVNDLLHQAYIHRDRVALLAFRGTTAQLLLPPSQSVELARRALDLLPTGGGTPLAAALLQAMAVAQQAKGRGIMQTVLVLLTDGRANVGLRAPRSGVDQELDQLGRQVAAAGIQSIVIDTQRSYLGNGEARQLATRLSGRYLYLPHASGADIAGLARTVSTGG